MPSSLYVLFLRFGKTGILNRKPFDLTSVPNSASGLKPIRNAARLSSLAKGMNMVPPAAAKSISLFHDCWIHFLVSSTIITRVDVGIAGEALQSLRLTARYGSFV